MFGDKNRNLNQDRESQIPLPSEDFFADMVKNGITTEFINNAEKWGAFLAESLSTSQIRRIFGYVKKIESFEDPKKFIPQLLMLKPMLAYTAKRHRGGAEKLKDIIDEAINAVTDAEIKNDKEKQVARFRLFCSGFEAILAYHRANAKD